MRTLAALWILGIFSMLFCLQGCGKGEKHKIPVIYISDLYHPHQDPDDHFDLAAMFAIDDFDIRAVIIDGAMPGKKPGWQAVEQLNYLTGRHVPWYRGLKEKLKSPHDDGLWQLEYQEGSERIIEILENAHEKVTIISVGSVRDLAAAYNRRPELFHEKTGKIVLFAGEASDRNFIEYNVGLDKNAWIGLMNNAPNIYWVPCFDGGLWSNNGKASYWQASHSELLGQAGQQLQNYFLFMFKNEPDSIDHISYLDRPISERDLHDFILNPALPKRNLWSCAVFPYFSNAWNPDDFPFDFQDVKIHFNDSAMVDYVPVGHPVKMFYIKDRENYGKRMTKIFRELISSYR